MSTADCSKHECWEYRQCYFAPSRIDFEGLEQGPGFIEWLIETLETIDRSEEGWQLVSAKIESETKSGPRVEVLMKRPLADSQEIGGSSSIPHAA